MQDSKTIEVDGWPWLPDKCPPDKYFIDYMRQKDLPPQNILHVGTGLHHKVGLECCAMGHNVIGVTVSREEVVSRVFRVEDERYQVFYANINTLDLSLLPKIDVLTLFHFGEMAYVFGPASAKWLYNFSVLNLTEAGRVLFYNRSAEWGNAKASVQEVVDHHSLKHVETYEELEVFQKW